MLSFREYILLKRIHDSIKENQKCKKYKSNIYFVSNFIEKYNYTSHTMNYLLSELYKKNLIQDTASEINTNVHAVSITDKGKFYLENYISTIAKHYLLVAAKTLITLVVGIIIENSVGIIDILKNIF